jgi:putative ABC transport system ATP-binding protein
MMIALRGVTRKFPTAAGVCAALDGVDLEVRPGEFVAIVGRSGSGKSTLLNLIGAIDRPSSGEITVAGTPLVRASEAALASWRGRNVGFVFQFFQLLPTLTAAENVMLPMDFVGATPARRRRPRALELLERLEIAAQADRLPAALSGGEQQRVAIARALVNRPSILLADEPTGNLDSATSAEIMRVFGQLQAQGQTVILVTHEADIAAHAHRVVTLRDGRLESDITRSASAAA